MRTALSHHLALERCTLYQARAPLRHRVALERLLRSLRTPRQHLPLGHVVERLPLRLLAALPHGVLLEFIPKALSAQGQDLPLRLPLPLGLGLPADLRLGLVLFQQPLRQVGALLSVQQVLEQHPAALRQALHAGLLLELPPPYVQTTHLVVRSVALRGLHP